MKFQVLSDVIDELSFLLTGARIERVYEGAGKTLHLILSRGRSHFFLLLSPERSLPRLHLVTEKPAAAASSNGFSLYLRSHASGGRITHVSLLNQDRVAEIRFSRQGREYRLVFELIGSASNMVLTDAESLILAVYYRAPLNEHVSRTMAPGARYVPPEKRTTQRFTPAAAPADRFSRQEQRDIAGAVRANREAEIYYNRLMERRGFDSLRAELGSLVRKSLAKTERLIQALSDDLHQANHEEEYKQAGDLILANLHRLEQGMTRAELVGHDGNAASVRLDPKRSLTGNAELYFKKYKKAKSGRKIISSRLLRARDGERLLQGFLSELDQAEDGRALSCIRSKLIDQGYLRSEIKEKNKNRSVPPPTSFRKIVCCGWEILVGKSAAGNDYITTKLARDSDLWLHAEGMPGSHVLVRNPEGREVPSPVLVRAASLAAFHSKGRNANKVAVIYTSARHVKKPKGAKPGLVTLTKRKTIMAVPAEG